MANKKSDTQQILQAVLDTTNAAIQVSVVSGAGVGGALESTQLLVKAAVESINNKTPSFGQALAANSSPVVLTAAQITTLTPLSLIAVTQSGVWDTRLQDGSGNAIGSITSPYGRSIFTQGLLAGVHAIDGTSEYTNSINNSISTYPGTYNSSGVITSSGDTVLLTPTTNLTTMNPGTVGITVKSGSGGIMSAEISTDGTTWYVVRAYRLDTTPGFVSTITTNGVYQVNMAGVRFFRINCTSSPSAAYTVNLRASPSTVNNSTEITGTIPLPTGASTSALQSTGNSSLSSIDGKITAVNTGAVVISSSVLPTGASTEATLAAFSAKLATQTDSNMGAASASTQRVAAMLGVSGAAVTNANPIPVTQIGTVGVSLETIAGATPLVNYGSPGTGSLRVAAMLGIGSTVHSDTNPIFNDWRFINGVAPETGYGTPSTGTQRVAAMLGVGTAIASAGAGANDSSTLRVSANLSFAGNSPTLNSGNADGNTLRVAVARDTARVFGSAIYEGMVYNASGLTTTYTSALTLLSGGTTMPTDINYITVFSSTGTTLRLTWGGGSPTNTNTLLIPPGGIDTLPVRIPASSDIRLSSNTGTSTGEVVINFLA